MAIDRKNSSEQQVPLEVKGYSFEGQHGVFSLLLGRGSEMLIFPLGTFEGFDKKTGGFKIGIDYGGGRRVNRVYKDRELKGGTRFVPAAMIASLQTFKG